MRSYLMILLAGFLWACSSDDEKNEVVSAKNLEVSKNEVKLTNVGGSFTINVTASGDWTAEVVSSNSGWLTLSKTSGSGNSDLRLFFTENTDDAKKPTAPIQIRFTISFFTKARISKEKIQATIFTRKYFISAIRANKKAPNKAPTVRLKK